jgi:hypothetical protein
MGAHLAAHFLGSCNSTVAIATIPDNGRRTPASKRLASFAFIELK